ncbi:hypothetical protein HFP57_09020 [Parasphingopyxis algicola]|uniref:DUF6969 family protein n=1 Tax=Parasphingopyxis algicola TaxID=2026624 RepID=UPI00159FAA27|nr:hypothetical protein [Parasphingopyxis algicola]QLC25149.1 hypothetical protein HFP57_09020 [Parasphingopyxis algicola]
MRSAIADDPEATLFALTEQMASQGVSLVPRVVPPESDFRQWDHYPQKDAISASNRSRWFYHAHPPEQREPGEHGHFHLFLPLDAFEGIEPEAAPEPRNKKGKTPAKVVHFIALSCNVEGIPTHWFTTNRWVTNEYFMPAAAIIERLDLFDVTDAPGDPLVNGWLTAVVAMFRDQISDLLRERDEALAGQSLDDRKLEILSSGPLAL